MSNLFVYLLQVTAGSVLLYLCFFLFYRNDTFYKRNRIMLMVVLFLPVIFPLLSIVTSTPVSTASQTFIIVDRFASAGQDMQSSVAGGIEKLNVSNIILFVWLTGVCLLLLRTSISLVRTFIIINKGEKVNKGSVKIIVSDLPHPPFSFWTFAVIPRDIYDTPVNMDIIKHEECHISQLHTIDLILAELFIAVFWFNPAAWLIKRSIILNHEYLADNKTINETPSLKEYQYRLVSLAYGMSNIHLMHNFNSNIRNRITMINKNATSPFAAMKTIFIIPVVALLLIVFSFKSTPGTQEKNDNQTLFSPESHKILMELLFKNVMYPTEAKNQDMTGRFFVIVKMKKGGIVDKVTVNDTDKSINVPLLGNEVVVIGYGLKNPAEAKELKAVMKDRSILTNEGVRVANMLGTVKIQEWENKDMEFAISFNFTLKYPEEKTSTIQIRDNSFQVNPDVLFMLDGKEITKKEMEKIDPNSISTVSVLKGESATKVFGEKGKNGVVIITTKK
jgi:beta-lactamase regulating signal transducer with metallopeptidase domain